MSLNGPDIQALCARFHLRAQVLGLKAKSSINALDAARFTSMAAVLQWAAQELSAASRPSRSGADVREVANSGEQCNSEVKPEGEGGKRETQS